MSNIALQIERTIAGSVDALKHVLFDTTAYLSGNISYNAATGVITFNEPGRYVIDWWVAARSLLSTGGVVFALVSSQGDVRRGNSPMKTGETMGIGILDVAVAPVSASLVNHSANTVYYSTNVPLTATLVAVRDDITGPTGNSPDR